MTKVAVDGWDDLAERLAGARADRTLLDPLRPSELPRNEADAYGVQDRLIADGGGEPRAWKLGATASAGQRAMGLSEPFAGPVLEILHSPATIDPGHFACHVFEPEIAITLGADIDGEIGEEEARAAIASYHPAIEIINFRIRNGRELGALGMITDHGANGALILGPGSDRPLDYMAVSLDVRIDGTTIAERAPPPPETEIGSLIAWFSAHAAARGYSLKVGDVITTGSQAGLLEYRPGNLVEADFGSLGIASVSF